MIRYASAFIILTVLGVLYEKYKLKFVPDEELKKYDLIKKYLLNGSEHLGGKPIMWVHSTHNINARHWKNFGSRNSQNLNQPYILSCIETIIKHCGDSFHICLIDDESFMKLLPKWNINVIHLPEPSREHIRRLAMAKILHYYGGVQIPDSMVMLQDFKPLHDKCISQKGFYVGDTLDRTITSEYFSQTVNLSIIGCKKNNETMKDYISFLELLNSRDYTNEIDFEGDMQKYLNNKAFHNKIIKLDASYFGQKDSKNMDVTLDRLMDNTYIDFKPNMVGLYIPKKMLLKRTKYNWFVRLSQNQLRHCDNIAAKILIIAQG